jgi:hypothetical protein
MRTVRALAWTTTTGDQLNSHAASCPQAGQGVHDFVLERVRHLYDYLEPEGIHSLIKLETANCGRDVPDAEIWRAIRGWAIRKVAGTRLRNAPYQRLVARSCKPPWPERDYQLIDELVRGGAGAEALFRTSPWPVCGRRLDPKKTLRWMFSQALEGTVPENDTLVCAGPSTALMRTKRLGEWGDSFRDQTFIVPNPMSKVQGINQEGRLSWRCLNNTGERWYLVIECDIKKGGSDKPEGPWDRFLKAWAEKGITIADANAAILWKLRAWLPLVLVVYSGGKSFHGWFICRGVDEQELHKFMRNAVLLGADRATWTRCQPVRMPEGIRWEDKWAPVRQRVVYFDPLTIEKWRRG